MANKMRAGMKYREFIDEVAFSLHGAEDQMEVVGRLKIALEEADLEPVV